MFSREARRKFLIVCVFLRVNQELFAREARRKFLGFSGANCGFGDFSRAKREENFAGFQGQSEVLARFRAKREKILGYGNFARSARKF